MQGHQQNIGSPTYCLVVITRENNSKIDVVCLLVNLSTKSSSFLNFISFMLKIRRIILSTIVAVFVMKGIRSYGYIECNISVYWKLICMLTACLPFLEFVTSVTDPETNENIFHMYIIICALNYSIYSVLNVQYTTGNLLNNIPVLVRI